MRVRAEGGCELKALKAGWHRLRIWWHGECSVEGCGEPSESFVDKCPEHWGEDFDRYCAQRAQKKFDREAEVVAEGIRRAGVARR